MWVVLVVPVLVLLLPLLMQRVETVLVPPRARSSASSGTLVRT
jgi:hypothetical protein